MAGNISGTGDARGHVSCCDRRTWMDPQSLYTKFLLLTLMLTPANIIYRHGLRAIEVC